MHIIINIAYGTHNYADVSWQPILIIIGEQMSSMFNNKGEMNASSLKDALQTLGLLIVISVAYGAALEVRYVKLIMILTLNIRM